MTHTPRHAADIGAPLTVFARHNVLPGKDPEFEAWVQGISAASEQFEGYGGTEVIRPVEKTSREFVAIFRFDSYDNLEAWMQSTARETWISRTNTFSDDPTRLDYHSLEFWFQPKQGGAQRPPRHKMALVTTLVIWPLVHFVPPAVAGVAKSPPIIIEALSVLIIVLLMTYLLMPAVLRLLAGWLLSSPPKGRTTRHGARSRPGS
ncbi:MAG: antibiotic biosynthesis monooxygenase [Nannocystaceae bacterium]|nr:antibiotic biosynthesis monooxygenase [Nannocystaceae bacterium]